MTTDPTVDTATLRGDLLALVSQQAGESVTEDQRLVDLDFDSLDVVELVHAVKSELGIVVNTFDLVHATTVGDLVDTVSAVTR